MTEVTIASLNTNGLDNLGPLKQFLIDENSRHNLPPRDETRRKFTNGSFKATRIYQPGTTINGSIHYGQENNTGKG